MLLPSNDAASTEIRTQDIDTSVPVLSLGGAGNSVILVRNLARLGIEVYASGPHGCLALSSRYCKKAFQVPEDVPVAEYWHQLLLSDDHQLDGCVIFGLCDDSVEFLCKNADALRKRYLVEDFDAELRLDMLDKKRTLEIARDAGVPYPEFWEVQTIEDVDRVRDELKYPLMVKPIHSHLFTPAFGRKLFIIENGFEEAREKAKLALDAGFEIMLVEMIPGPDTQLCSYYTYHDKHGRSLFDFTKKVLRRYPMNRGGAVYHETEWIPASAEVGKKFFASMPWRGMANIEFKKDPRDGLLKVIECNPRFTAAHILVTEAGAPIDVIAYCAITDQPGPSFSSFKEGVRQWNPSRDFLAFLELRRLGLLTFGGWIKSIMHRPILLPVFDIRDPVPSFSFLSTLPKRFWKKIGRTGR